MIRSFKFTLLTLSIGILFILITNWLPLYSSKPETYVVTNQEGTPINLTLYKDGPKLAVLAHGFSSESRSLVWVRNQFIKKGYSVATFDFTGHGGSKGAVGFDNATTERLSYDLEYVVDYLIGLGYESSSITLYGHSMGGRSILQYTTRSNISFEQIYLVGPEVNLLPNTQASFFTGANDLKLPFTSRLSSESPAAPVTIIASTWDDIHKPEASKALYHRLSTGPIAYPRNQVFVDNIFHNYLNYAQMSLIIMTGDGNPLLTIWYALIPILFIIPIVWYHRLEKSELIEYTKTSSLKSLGYWGLGIILGAILLIVMIITPLRKPFFATQFVILIGGYGLSYWIIHLRRLNKQIFKPIKRKSETFIAFTSLLFAQYAFRFSAMQSFQLNIDFVIWFIVFVLLTTLGFLALQEQKSTWIKYLPFILFFGFYLILGSISGLVTTTQGILFLIYAVYSSKVIFSYSQHEGLSALMMGLILGIPLGAFF